MTKLNNEVRELIGGELDAVSGAGWTDVAIAAVELYNFFSEHHGISDSINYIKGQAGK